MTHRYAEALRWLADGKTVLARFKGGPEAEFPGDLTQASSESVLLGHPDWEFRLKPHAVKIGSREIEAPVLEPIEGQCVYWTAASGTENSSRFAHDDDLMVERARAGRLFASEDAARVAHGAIAALLRGEA